MNRRNVLASLAALPALAVPAIAAPSQPIAIGIDGVSDDRNGIAVVQNDQIIAAGDVVSCHACGPQLMTVASVEWPLVQCLWFDGNDLREAIYSLHHFRFTRWAKVA